MMSPSEILWVPVDQVISANQRTQGDRGRKGISLEVDMTDVAENTVRQNLASINLERYVL